MVSVSIVCALALWIYVFYLWGLLDRQLAATMAVVEVPMGLLLAWLISRFVERSPEELAKRFAEEKQKLEELAKAKDEAQANLKIHYQNLIQRMEEWSYLYGGSGEMICLAAKDKMFGTRRSGTPVNLENDKMHLKEFKKTHDLYLDGKKLSHEYETKYGETSRYLESLFQEKKVTDFEEQWNLTWSLRMMISAELRLRRLVLIPEYPPKLVKIREELKQHQGLRRFINDELTVEGEIKKNEQDFLNSLEHEVIDSSKESNYSLPQLLNGVCDHCKHLKAILS